MIRLFPEFRRPWSDSLSDPHEFRDPYEVYFGLFGGGDDSGGGGDDNDDGGRKPGEPQVFGVDGKSKTGSTSQDEKIGYTDGSGGKGSNYAALDDATSQQTAAAVAAANAAEDAGGNETAQQAAVGNILDSYDPAAVSQTGQLTDTGQGLVAQSVQQALEDTAEAERIQKDQQAANIMGLFTDATPVQTPENFDADLDVFLDTGVFPGDEVLTSMTLPSPSPARALQASPYSGTNNTMLTNKMLAQGTSQEERQSILQELRNRATVGDEDARQKLADVELQEELGLAGSGRVDLSAPDAFAGPSPTGIVSVAANQPPTGTVSITRQAGPGGDTSSQELFNTLDPATQALITGTGTTAPASTGPLSPAEELNQQIQAAAAASTRTPEQQAGITPTGPMGAQAAAGTPAENFYADAYRELNPDIETIPGTTLAGISGGLTNLFGGDAPSAQDAAAFQSGQLLSLGGTMDPETGAISGAQAGPGTLNMNRFGMVTYSGMPDPDYEGPFANLVRGTAGQNMAGGSDQSVMQQQTQVDPCPPGYQLDPATQQCVPIDVVDDQPFTLGRREYGPSESPSLIGTPVSPFQSPTLQPTAPNMGFMRQAVNPFGFARGGIVELPKK